MPRRSAKSREDAREVRDLRRLFLRELGWSVVSDTCVFAPGDHDRSAMSSLAAAARDAGLPLKLEELAAWKPDTAVAYEPVSPAECSSARRSAIGEPWRIPRATE